MNEIREELTEEQQKADAVQNQDVRNVSNVMVTQELHLLLGSAHEQEATGVKQEGWQILEAVDLVVVLAVRSDIRGSLVAEDEADLDNPGQACTHERVAEDGMNVGAQVESLWVAAHAPSSHHDYNARDEVTTRTTLAIAW
jgi:hypothetical protein